MRVVDDRPSIAGAMHMYMQGRWGWRSLRNNNNKVHKQHFGPFYVSSFIAGHPNKLFYNTRAVKPTLLWCLHREGDWIGSGGFVNERGHSLLASCYDATTVTVNKKTKQMKECPVKAAPPELTIKGRWEIGSILGQY